MTEIEWLKQESGMTDEEWTAMSALGGSGKLLTGIKKALGLSEQALADKVAAENERLSLEKRYQEEMIPELQRVTQDALRARGEAARMAEQLKTARQYGIVPDEPPVPEPVRAPGSPDPNQLTRDDLSRFTQQQSNTLITLNDLNAEHFKLFGTPLPNTQELVNEVNRQR